MQAMSQILFWDIPLECHHISWLLSNNDVSSGLVIFWDIPLVCRLIWLVARVSLGDDADSPWILWYVVLYGRLLGVSKGRIELWYVDLYRRLLGVAKGLLTAVLRITWYVVWRAGM